MGRGMTTSEERARAAATIDPESLAEARGAVEARCRLFLRRLDLLEAGIENVRRSGDVHRFSLALSMFLLDSLPLKPEACPFCVQNAGGCRCEGCGYAEAHGGRCDAEASAFGQLAEAVDDLAGQLHVLRNDLPARAIDLQDAGEGLRSSIEGSRAAAKELMAEAEEADVPGLMEAKRDYVEAILDALPAGCIGSKQVDGSLKEVREKLVWYW
jgi:hypothetical protein